MNSGGSSRGITGEWSGHSSLQTCKMMLMRTVNQAASEGLVRVSALKDFAARELPDGPLRSLILTEKDWIDKEDFISKVGVWLRLPDMHEENDRE
ncbi:MAG: hypothetical protein OK438_06825 [Thaumarchaeota archaeon]|nr:hypothetical protein [Nitrososphaerota archaeon]